VLLDEFKNIMPNGPWYQLQVMALPRIADMSSRSEEHLGLLNEAVRSHDWTAFLATRHDPLQLGRRRERHPGAVLARGTYCGPGRHVRPVIAVR
jgi:hypothetical protein